MNNKRLIIGLLVALLVFVVWQRQTILITKCRRFLEWNPLTPNKGYVMMPSDYQNWLKKILESISNETMTIFGVSIPLDVVNIFYRNKSTYEIDSDVKQHYVQAQRVYQTNLEKERVIAFIEKTVNDAVKDPSGFNATSIKVLEPVVHFYSNNPQYRECIAVYCLVFYEKSHSMGVRVAGVVYTDNEGRMTLVSARLVNDNSTVPAPTVTYNRPLEYGIVDQKNVVGNASCGIPSSLDGLISKLS